jgi:F-type H+-transporting ATPase subunit a
MLKALALVVVSLLSLQTYASGGFTWLGGLSHMLHLPGHTLTLIIIGIFLITLGLLYQSKISKVSDIVVPDKGITLRNIVELYGNFIYGQCKSVIGEKEGPKYFTFISTVFLLILISNLIGLIPGFLPPTEYLSTTLAFAAASFIYYNIQGCKEQGTLNYLKHFAGPLWYLAFLIFPIEIVSNLIRPLSLALRLRFNMMGDHIVLTEASNLMPVLLPIPFMILGLLVSLIQAYVFTILTMVYIQMAVEHHDHDEEHAH